MYYLQQYQQKLVTAAEAVKVVKSGDWIKPTFEVCGANELDQALAQRVDVDEIYDVKIGVDRPHYTFEADPAGEHFLWYSWNLGGLDRKYCNQGQLYYIPMKFHECPVMTCNNCDPTNVFMATVSPINKHRPKL